MSVQATYATSNPPPNPPVNINLSGLTYTINYVVNTLAQYIPLFIPLLVLLEISKYAVNEFGELIGKAVSILGGV